jgi:hypothetical protein
MLGRRVAVCIPSFLLFFMEIMDIRNGVGLKYVGKLRALPRSSHSFMCSLDLCDQNLLSSRRNKGLGQIKIWQGDILQATSVGGIFRTLPSCGEYKVAPPIIISTYEEPFFFSWAS